MLPFEDTLWSEIAQRLTAGSRISGSCIEYQASINEKGYGVIQVKGRRMFAHRLSYVLCHGPVPHGKELDHLCRNRACINPDHLEPVTRRENILRGIAPSAINARRTHCTRGHELTPENTYHPPCEPNSRFCRACRLLRRPHYNQQRRERRAALRANGATK
jgi:HNH endonuclease